MSRWHVYFILLGLAACNQTSPDLAIEDGIKSIPKQQNFNQSVVPHKVLALAGNSSELLEAERLEQNLFGRFHCDRAGFYIIKAPQNLIFDTRPSSIVLYYLDNKLGQTKYLLPVDISKALLKKFGGFKITPRDLKNRNLVKQKQFFIKNPDGSLILNPDLDNVELKWLLDDKEIRYRIFRDAEDKFIYTERTRSYTRELGEIESECI